MKKFILMIQFLTRIPISAELDATQEEFGKGLAFAPLVGLIIGGLTAGVYYVLSFAVRGLILPVIAIIFYCLITGALHIDGLGDTFDGIFSNRPKERILEIMRDSRLGTNGLLAILAVILLNISALASMDSSKILAALWYMPVIGRLGSVCSAGMSSYARTGEGLGKAFIDYCGFKQIMIGGLFAAVIGFVFFQWKVFILVFICMIFTYIFVRYITSKIGGMTGDTCGAACELNQALFLIILMVI